MDAFREWTLCLIVSAAAGSIVCAVAPRGATDKTVRTVVGIFVVVTVCTPLTELAQTDFDYAFASSYNGSDSGEELNELMLENCRKAIEDELEAIAQKHKIEFTEVRLDAYIDEYNCINIQNIQLGSNGANYNGISSFEDEAEKILGIPVKVSVD